MFLCFTSLNYDFGNLTPSNLSTGRYIDSYIAYPGKFIQSYTNHVTGNGSSADLCAYQCNSDPTCKSFDYCKDKWCYFNTEHIVHIPPVLVASALTCTHYSSK